ncbi:MAG: hypothetical protein DI551_11725 [Micavibrio aeruginosavorus]|uniref:Uncharacterized protein n=1 Tax=Micavibrio aeruginosavorus TaxID=349221 RepID=A0A2W5MQQ4_9BACT|nr:MAG: hypothetical protein DI551_11725 [Micavibrio aeruginosavorus]
MDLSVSTALPDSLAALRRAQAYRIAAPATSTPATQEAANLPVISNISAKTSQTGTKLVADTSEELEDGRFRRTQTFEREDGRSFTRVEDFTLTQQGARRTVYQQNPSGAITTYEEVLDREQNGSFRRTQRFQDEAGDTATQITTNYKVTDAFILTGGSTARNTAYPSASPFSASRGTQLDLQA